jgi:hypothetical protein
MVQGGRPPTASACQGDGVEPSLKEASVEQANTIGLDIAKHVFQVHGADAGHVLFRKRVPAELGSAHPGEHRGDKEWPRKAGKRARCAVS